ncbi:UTRA domain-containing protein, partial [Pseudomonas sp. PNPG3]|uniref:UTRA domain-containing protein n=1 Tax=Pseudomonas sp. PNPG3 TaxID=2919497 RepID=UPI001FFCB232
HAPTREELTTTGLYEALRQRGVTSVLAHERIGATVADVEHAELLDEEPGAALLTMERKSFANDGTVVEFGLHVYRA